MKQRRIYNKAASIAKWKFRHYQSRRYYKTQKGKMEEMHEIEKTEADWEEAPREDTLFAYKHFILEHPYSHYVDQARKIMDSLLCSMR